MDCIVSKGLVLGQKMTVSVSVVLVLVVYCSVSVGLIVGQMCTVAYQ